MKFFCNMRMLILAFLISVVPASSFAGVFISVGFAPPMLPVYDQPPCPEEGLMWMPGYWAYGDEGYFWVPGTWVPAPYEGALWTPPYWGWSEGLFVFHPGYWGRHVGYYGGVNYGYGYMGVGFVGGMWRGHDFVYNRAVMRVDDRHVRNTYEDRNIVERNTVVNEGHVAFSGGPGGIRHDAMPEERLGEHENHLGATSFQVSHESSAMGDRNAYATRNGGHPQYMAVPHPMNQGSQPNPRGSYQNEPGGKAGAVGGYQGVYQGPGNENRGNQNNGNQNNGNQNNGYQGRGNPGGNYNQPQPYNAPNNGNNQPRNYGQPQPNNGGQPTKTYNASHSNTGNAPVQQGPTPRQHTQQQPQHNAPPPQNSNQGKGQGRSRSRSQPQLDRDKSERPTVSRGPFCVNDSSSILRGNLHAHNLHFKPAEVGMIVLANAVGDVDDAARRKV